MEGHGTVGLLADYGDADNGGDSFGREADRMGRSQTDITVLQPPPNRSRFCEVSIVSCDCGLIGLRSFLGISVIFLTWSGT